MISVSELTQEQADAIEAEIDVAKGNRICGTCTACCTVQGVVELQKPNYTSCCHLAKNCTIYADRPRSCRVWACNWLIGREPGGDVRNRPDQLGLIFKDEWISSEIGWLLTAWEVWPGAANESRQRTLIEKMSWHRPVAVVSDAGEFGEKYTLVCPNPEQAECIRIELAKRVIEILGNDGQATA